MQDPKTDEKYKDKKIFSLAFAPPPSMSRVPEFVQDCMYSFINKEDVIPHLSLSNILNTMNLKEIYFETYLDMFIKLCKSSMIKKAQDISNLLEKHKKEIVKTFHAIKDDLHVN